MRFRINNQKPTSRQNLRTIRNFNQLNNKTMIPKKYFAAGAAAVLIFLALAAIARLGSNGQKQSLTDNKTLTRESAAKIILNEIQEKPYPEKKILAGKTAEGYKILYNHFDKNFGQSLLELERNGLIHIVKSENSDGLAVFDFTDKAQSYIKPSGPDFDIVLAKPYSVEVTGLTSSAENSGGKKTRAEFIAKYKLTPFGEIIKGELLLGPIIDKGKSAEDLNSYANFTLYDDGWRISR